ncbi:MAG: M24 family metallopeptidase, partial [Dehalococcoidia bacterium]
MDSIKQAQEFLSDGQTAEAWLVYDYHGMNPVFAELTGLSGFFTRPVFLLISASGKPVLLVSAVDAGQVRSEDYDLRTYVGRENAHRHLQGLLSYYTRVAMEYSPLRELPGASRVDAGTVELVRSFGVEVVSSAELLQYATQRWTEAGLAAHRRAADALGNIVLAAFEEIGNRLGQGITEHDVSEYIMERFAADGLTTDHGPVVAANAHGSDPHFEPTPESSVRFAQGNWVLIDLWARDPGPNGIYADITWTAYVGGRVPEQQRRVFDVVTGARDAAVEFLEKRLSGGGNAQGWEVDRVAREYIAKAGYEKYFFHRLGHSLGRQVHAGGVNLDSLETHDTRSFLQGLGFTIEPGVYLPEFGVRSEIDLYIGLTGLEITTPVQR